MGDDTVAVCGVQVRVVDASSAAERDSNVAHCVAQIEAAHGKHGADVYVLPELSAIGYDTPKLAAHAAALAEDPQTGPSTTAYAALAARLKVHIVYGFPMLSDALREQQPQQQPEEAEHVEEKAAAAVGGDGGAAAAGDAHCSVKPYIAQGVVGPSGAVVCTYRKLHVCDFGVCSESDTFQRGPGGEGALAVFAVRGVKIGVLVCFDLRFARPWQRYRELGCACVLHPSCFPNDGSFLTWHNFVKTRAWENQMYVMSLSRAHPMFGHSLAVGPYAQTEQEARGDEIDHVEEDTLLMHIDPARIAAVRKEIPFHHAARDDF